MKRKVEQTNENEFSINTPLTEAIEAYNLILKKVNRLKVYQKPSEENGINYRIKEENKEAFINLENQRYLALEYIETLLNQGQDPNKPQEEIKYTHQQGTLFKVHVINSPLFLATDKALIELLLQFNAGPTMKTYRIFEKDYHIQSPISFAYQNQYFLKLYLFSILKPDMIKFSSIAEDMSQKEIHNKIDAIDEADYDSRVDAEHREKVRNLAISRVNSEKCILTLTEKAIYANTTPSEKAFNKLDHLIYQLKSRFFQLRVSPFSLFILNELTIFPLDIVNCIMLNFHPSMTTEAQINKIYDRVINAAIAQKEQISREKRKLEQLKLDAFRVIHTILLENKSYFVRAEFVDFNGAISLKTLEEKKNRDCPLINKAWDLMAEHYENIEESVEELIQWAVDNDNQYRIEHYALSNYSFFSARKENYANYFKEKVTTRFNELLMELIYGTQIAEDCDIDCTI